MAARRYPDLHDHLQKLRDKGLLVTIERPIDKDSELHPLVRWQFVGGLAEKDRKAFLFTNIRDAGGRRYEMPVVPRVEPQRWRLCKASAGWDSRPGRAR